MRSYGQACSVARSLDVLGDRWTLLIVRELLIRGAGRYTDLRRGLPGIATNLLAERLRELEDAGVVSREEAPPPIATTLYRLTERGEQLRPAIMELGRWGMPLMHQPEPADTYQTHWLPVGFFLQDHSPELPPIAIQVDLGDELMSIVTEDGQVNLKAGTVREPDATITGPPQPILGLVSGAITLAQARQRGVSYKGDPGALERLLPRPPITTV